MNIVINASITTLLTSLLVFLTYDSCVVWFATTGYTSVILTDGVEMLINPDYIDSGTASGLQLTAPVTCKAAGVLQATSISGEVSAGHDPITVGFSLAGFVLLLVYPPIRLYLRYAEVWDEMDMNGTIFGFIGYVCGMGLGVLPICANFCTDSFWCIAVEKNTVDGPGFCPKQEPKHLVKNQYATWVALAACFAIWVSLLLISSTPCMKRVFNTPGFHKINIKQNLVMRWIAILFCVICFVPTLGIVISFPTPTQICIFLVAVFLFLDDFFFIKRLHPDSDSISSEMSSSHSNSDSEQGILKTEAVERIAKEGVILKLLFKDDVSKQFEVDVYPKWGLAGDSLLSADFTSDTQMVNEIFSELHLKQVVDFVVPSHVSETRLTVSLSESALIPICDEQGNETTNPCINPPLFTNIDISGIEGNPETVPLSMINDKKATLKSFRTQNKGSCFVCYTRSRCLLFYPCRHYACCLTCLSSMMTEMRASVERERHRICAGISKRHQVVRRGFKSVSGGVLRTPPSLPHFDPKFFRLACPLCRVAVHSVFVITPQFRGYELFSFDYGPLEYIEEVYNTLMDPIV